MPGPTLVVTGWYDPWATEAVAAHQHIAALAGGADHRLVIAPAGHGFDPVRHWHLPDDAHRFGLDVDHRWALESLAARGRELRDLAPVTYWMVADDSWRSAPSWPPPEATPRMMHLVPAPDRSGGLDEAPPEGRPTAVLLVDPAAPVPSRGGGGMILPPGPVDQRGLTGGAREDVLSFDGEPAPVPVELAGPVTATITITPGGPDADVVVKLLDVAPDGTASVVVDGIARARWREGGATPVWLERGRPQPIEVWLGHVAHRVHAGHRLRVDIAGSSFPRWDVNPCTGEPEGRVDPRTRPKVHHLVHGGIATPSTVTIHVLPPPPTNGAR
jgi:putative CocE/NonD family hydrolase